MDTGLQASLLGTSFEKSFLPEDLQGLVLKAAQDYYRAYSTLGYRGPALSSPASLNKIKTLHHLQALNIIESLNMATRWLIDARDESLGTIERNHLHKALNHYGLQADDDLLATIDEDTVVEIYTSDMVQVYRNLKLLDVTGYSILDLSVFEWWILWERAQFATKKIVDMAYDVLEKQIPLQKFSIAPHALKETFNAGMTEPFIPRNIEVHMGYMGFLKPTRKDSPVALMSTCKAEVLDEGFQETENLVLLK